MILLIFGSAATFAAIDSPYIGQLISPRSGNLPRVDRDWAADNDCFSDFHAPRYVTMLSRLARVADRSRLRFVTVPDVIGNAAATRAQWETWAPILAALELPAAYVVQDGATMESVPWVACSAVFVGGSTRFKESREAAELVLAAKARGKWVHMGRVNSIRRTRYAQSIGCDSIDGYQFSAFRSAYVKQWLPVLASEQLTIGAIYELPNRVSGRDLPRGGATRKSHRRGAGSSGDDSDRVRADRPGSDGA